MICEIQLFKSSIRGVRPLKPKNYLSGAKSKLKSSCAVSAPALFSQAERTSGLCPRLPRQEAATPGLAWGRYATIRSPHWAYKIRRLDSWCPCYPEEPDTRGQNVPAHKEIVGSPRSIRPKCVE